jgi:hypothetical protein
VQDFRKGYRVVPALEPRSPRLLRDKSRDNLWGDGVLLSHVCHYQGVNTAHCHRPPSVTFFPEGFTMFPLLRLPIFSGVSHLVHRALSKGLSGW